MSSDISFPPADIDGELNTGNNVHVEVDPVSSEVAATKKSKVLPIKRTILFSICIHILIISL